MTHASDPLVGLLDDARALAPELDELRRALHTIPEVGLDLPETQAALLEALDGLDLEVQTGSGLSSVTAVLRGAKPGPTVLLRADMDALPVTEDSTDVVRSGHEGVMHACGHDFHMAGLVGAARLLHARRAEIAGSVLLMFQPGEEGRHGARLMLDEGLLDAAGERPVGAYGLHVFSAQTPTRVVTGKPGTVFAAVDTLHVTIHGRGGHGSAPHTALDPVPVAAEIVLALQSAVTRQFSIFDPVVVTVGKIWAGTKDNIIPATAHLDATVRTFSPATHDVIEARLRRVVDHVAAAHGLTAEIEWEPGYPVTVNDPAENERAERVARTLLGDEGWATMTDPVAGAEDFSYVLEEVPGAYLILGATPEGADPATAAYNHSPQATFDESVLPVGAAFLAGLALDRLAQG
ncbi:M20 family metallopeptidase [Actinotalea sp. M2MS4P-6]|uniref:M20 metallopeptidase family protein n=1 Tax=Actinotalea sp. M2MS4P-6 TaxID=2983762 RepID=UPI0021E4EEA9|nr:M20 family metallopeptidase [Actinotalea sp. M2MS4P-6]MCV2393071.1 M20 family metallopeptidase [Actinotalea sp. M2MS4P-6]